MNNEMLEKNEEFEKGYKEGYNAASCIVCSDMLLRLQKLQTEIRNEYRIRKNAPVEEFELERHYKILDE